MDRFKLFFITIIILTGCNSVYLKPNTLDVSKNFYADRGGYTMQRTIKETMIKRGYKIVVGKATTSKNFTDNSTSIDVDTSIIPENTHYIIKTKERQEIFRPVWCIFNGFWWWNFNVSIANQETGEEIMTWHGRGCVNSSIRKLDKILDKLEISEN